ncbi:serine hydrolase [Devosia sp. 1635]|uniref:serine hydrolase n=1 Tax=Devosia sp. 1635 TaxID=2726066 RepID=UPI0015633C81|nr:serine hydrolase [Devosia sp. 1635]
MNRRTATLLTLGLCATPALAQTASSSSPDIAAALADRLDRAGQGKGIATARVHNGEVQFAGHGVVAEGGAPVSETTIFEIGSISKLFTNLLLAQLVLDGAVSLHAPVANYLPAGTAVPSLAGREITLFDLATHSAGLPAIPPDLGVADPADPYRGYSAEQLLAFLTGYTLLREPGSQFEYSNTGAALLGLALEHTGGKPYADLVHERILEPLGMTETGLVPVDPGRFATGHDRAGNAVPHWGFDVFAPAGGYCSTAADLTRFVQAASGAVVTDLAPAFALMLAEQRPAGSPNMRIGLGWMVLNGPTGPLIWHNGITGGFNSFIGYAPESKAGAVVLANAVTQTGIEDLGFHLLEPSLPLAPQPEGRVPVSIDPGLLPRYAGTYRLGPEFDLVVTSEGGRLFVQASGQERLEVLPQSETEFFYTVVDAQISFELDAEEQVTGLVLHQNGQDIPGKRQ